jgi:hypothetical protein
MRPVILAALAASTLLAQLDRGTLTGTVTDPAGAVVPQATVTMVHLGTQAASSAVTNQDGQYSRPNLPIGDYRITVEAPGFKRTVREGIKLGVTEVLRVDVQLEIGSAAESVQVTAEVPKLQTDTPQISTSLGAKALINLPLSFSGGRQAESFAYMITPGVSGGTFESHINGSTSFSKETLVDGASVTVNQGGDFAPMAVSVEALAEVRFQTSGMTAEYGRTQSGVFNYVMKSGTNQLHGSAYFGLRNEALKRTLSQTMPVAYPAHRIASATGPSASVDRSTFRRSTTAATRRSSTPPTSATPNATTASAPLTAPRLSPTSTKAISAACSARRWPKPMHSGEPCTAAQSTTRKRFDR